MSKDNPYLVDILSKKQKLKLRLLFLQWFILNILFLVWWNQSNHINNLTLFLINSSVVFWNYLLPAYFFFFVARMQRFRSTVPIPNNWRVAMVVTKAPSEPFELVQKTLLKMILQKYPHDVWIADEDPTKEVLAWCEHHGVKVSTRKGHPEYQNSKWPRREKSKEGNLAYFYDKYGYDQYDIVCQLDADHIPQDHYLENMIRPFVDEKVGYVSAPSICSNNAKQSWSARARLYSEGFLHGAQQAGHTNGFAPLCFGSHYAVRTKALKEIGGLGPELAEDHSTTLIMNANGWRGVHAIDAIALGDGPATFEDAMTQEFQWARSLMNIFLVWTPKLFKPLPLRLKVQFLFAQLWYLLFTFFMLLGVLIPIIAISLNEALVNIPYFQYFVFNLIIIASTFSIVNYLIKLNLTRPKDVKIFSWELFVFQIARWPWVLSGIVLAVWDFINKKEFKFKVTPKTHTEFRSLPLSFLVPYIVIMVLYSIVGAFAVSNNASGYYYFLITGYLTQLITLGYIVKMHFYENATKSIS